MTDLFQDKTSRCTLCRQKVLQEDNSDNNNSDNSCIDRAGDNSNNKRTYQCPICFLWWHETCSKKLTTYNYESVLSHDDMRNWSKLREICPNPSQINGSWWTMLLGSSAASHGGGGEHVDDDASASAAIGSATATSATTGTSPRVAVGASASSSPRRQCRQCYLHCRGQLV